MRKRKRKVKSEHRELKKVYDKYVQARKNEDWPAALHYAELAEPLTENYRYNEPEFADRSMWLSMIRETWQHPEQLERLRNEFHE